MDQQSEEFQNKMNDQLKKLGKCQKSEHQRHDLVMVCLDKNCTEKQRIGCAKCICDFHFSHPSKCLFLKDILTVKTQIPIPNWSNNKIEQIIENTIDGLEVSNDKPINLEQIREILFSEIKIQRENLKKSLQNNKEKVSEIIQKISQKFKGSFDLTEIFNEYQKYVKKTISIKDFQINVNQILKNEIRLKNLKEMEKNFKKKDQICPQLSKSNFQDVQTSLISDMAMISQSMRLGRWHFVLGNLPNYNKNIKILKEGQQIEFNNLDTQQYVVASQPLKESGVHEWTLKFENFPTNSFNNLYVGLVQDSKKEDASYIFSNGSSAYIDILQQSSHSQHFQPLPNKKYVSEYVKKEIQEKRPVYVSFRLDYNNKTFRIFDEKEECVQVYSQEKLKTQQRNNVHLQQQTHTFFSKFAKLRPFVIGYSAQFKLTLEQV